MTYTAVNGLLLLCISLVLVTSGPFTSACSHLWRVALTSVELTLAFLLLSDLSCCGLWFKKDLMLSKRISFTKTTDQVAFNPDGHVHRAPSS